ncbi:MAG: hypothetical protein KBT27_05365 [Prevotellaceae bacterium]|nr:hypothetical protein [Candidatus Faecinaster equi]
MYMVMYAEVYQDGVWHKVGKKFNSWFVDVMTDRVCDERNEFLYCLFGGSDVANTDYCMTPLTDLRGLPEDVSSEIKHNNYFEQSVDISASYLTLDEILKFNWDAEIYKVGNISEYSYKRWKEQGIQPARWNWPVKSNSKIISPLEMDMILNGVIERDRDVKYFVKVNYDYSTYKEQCKMFYSDALAKLITLGAPNEVRVVYMFQ